MITFVDTNVLLDVFLPDPQTLLLKTRSLAAKVLFLPHPCNPSVVTVR
jgi:hypothetical protein